MVLWFILIISLKKLFKGKFHSKMFSELSKINPEIYLTEQKVGSQPKSPI